MNTLRCTISSVDRVFFQGEVESVQVPTSSGVQTILPHHEPLVSGTSKGTIRVMTEAGEQIFDIENGGVVEVLGSEVHILL